MTVTVEMTYGVTVSEEIEHTHENKVSVESSIRKSWVAVAQKEAQKQVMYGVQAAQKGLDGLAAGASRKRRRSLQETGEDVLGILSSDGGDSLADLLSNTEETFKEFKHTHKHS